MTKIIDRGGSVERARGRGKSRFRSQRNAHHVLAERRGGRMTEARRQEIVRKAATLFIEKGYANVTIDEIIRLVGGSKTTLYSCFGGKQQLFETVIRQPCIDMSLVVDVDASGDIETQLIQIGRRFLKSVLDPNIIELHRLMVSTGKTLPSVGAFFYDKGPNTAYSIVAKWIAKQQALGKLGGRNPRELSVLFLDMLIGEHQLALLTSPRMSSPKAIEKTVRAAVSLFLYGAAPRPTQRR
jgi:TetR/AcrR family transcriptional regulator, mexJK operon transcriptional repressor